MKTMSSTLDESSESDQRINNHTLDETQRGQENAIHSTMGMTSGRAISQSRCKPVLNSPQRSRSKNSRCRTGPEVSAGSGKVSRNQGGFMKRDRVERNAEQDRVREGRNIKRLVRSPGGTAARSERHNTG